MSDAVSFRVRLTPRGGQDRIEGWFDDPEKPDCRLVKVRVAAPPVDGAANKALIALLARSAGVAKSAVRITSGQASRIKTVHIDGVAAEILERLATDRT